VIEPNSVLIFEIDLVEISKAITAVTPPVTVTPQGAIPVKPNATTPNKPAVAVSPPISVPPLKNEGGDAPKTDPKPQD
jgi:hypothetical protein